MPRFTRFLLPWLNFRISCSCFCVCILILNPGVPISPCSACPFSPVLGCSCPVIGLGQTCYSGHYFYCALCDTEFILHKHQQCPVINISTLYFSTVLPHIMVVKIFIMNEIKWGLFFGDLVLFLRVFDLDTNCTVITKSYTF